MDTFFIEFRDPLFGVIVFFFLLFVLSFLSYWWGRHKTAKGHRDLESFLGKFESLEMRTGYAISTDQLPPKRIVAHACPQLRNAGNFEKSVRIYTLLSKP